MADFKKSHNESSNLRERSSTSRGEVRSRLHKALESGKITPKQLDAMKDLLSEIRKHCNIVDALSGAHVVVHDKGRLYKEWQDPKYGAVAREGMKRSSHYPDVKAPQYEIIFPNLGAILFGLTTDEPDACTWFQMERHGTQGFDALLHALDFVEHIASGHKNVGPLGTSSHSEKQGTELHSGEVPRIGDFLEKAEKR